MEILVGLLNTQYLPNLIKVENNFDLFHLMNKKKFDHTGIDNTEKHQPSLIDDGRIPQRLRGHFITQKLDTVTA